MLEGMNSFPSSIWAYNENFDQVNKQRTPQDTKILLGLQFSKVANTRPSSSIAITKFSLSQTTSGSEEISYNNKITIDFTKKQKKKRRKDQEPLLE